MVIISRGTEEAPLMMVSESFDKNPTEGFTKHQYLGLSQANNS